MLSAVLKKEDCKACGFCCSFRRQSLWELPRLPLAFADDHKIGANGQKVDYRVESSESGEWVVTDLTDRYVTDDPEEEVACPFLDREKGCTLGGDDKPFECSAWPLRYMRMPDGKEEVCLTPTCPVINKTDINIMKKYAGETWADAMKEYAKEHPYIIKDYKEGFIVL